MLITRRDAVIGAGATAAVAATFGAAEAQTSGPPDRVLITNEASNTVVDIDPVTLTVRSAINLTSYDEDPRAPFQFVTGGISPTHAALTSKPLYRGAIGLHGAAPSPDQTLLACAGRGSSNLYLIDLITGVPVGRRVNPQASDKTNAFMAPDGILIGREPHEPTFTRNGVNLIVALRGEERLAVLDVEQARCVLNREATNAIVDYVPTSPGPAQVWFSRAGHLAFVCSQRGPTLDIFHVDVARDGQSRFRLARTIDTTPVDRSGFTPFQKLSPDGGEMWFSHKLSDAVSSREVSAEGALQDRIDLGAGARPNHVEFIENSNGSAVYVSLARIDDGRSGAASSRLAIIDRSAPAGRRGVASVVASGGREAHGLWVDPDHQRLFVAHEQDELPMTEHDGQTVCSVFDVSDPFLPSLIQRIPLGALALPSGRLRNKQSINLVYVRPGKPMHSG